MGIWECRWGKRVKVRMVKDVSEMGSEGEIVGEVISWW